MHALPAASATVVVVAHPDDESFGLGALVDALSRAGSKVSLLCFTRGEASTLGGASDLAAVRAVELETAAEVLGVSRLEVHDYPDGDLAATPVAELADLAAARLAAERADLALVFDEGGITGHADHRQATAAGLAAGRSAGVPVLAWALPEDVAHELNGEFGTGFVGRGPGEIDLRVPVDRGTQQAAIAAHASQSDDNPVLRRRLELLGGWEHARWLYRPGA